LAKQFRTIATDEDLQKLKEVLTSMAEVDMLSVITEDDLLDLRPLDDLEISLSTVENGTFAFPLGATASVERHCRRVA
jgi:hypothetical protein